VHSAHNFSSHSEQYFLACTVLFLSKHGSHTSAGSVSQNVLKFYQQLTGEERSIPFILVGTISNVLVMEIDWTDVGSGGSFEAKSKGITVSQDLWLSGMQALQHTTSC
jgi:hypothetical protein